MRGGGQYFSGLDLGQSRDHTALAVLERTYVKGDWDAVQFAHRRLVELRLRYLERVPLGTSYPDMVERIASIMREVGQMGMNELLLDAGGVGRPVVDLFRRAPMPCGISPVQATGGSTVGQVKGIATVPKRDLIAGVQVALQNGTLKIAADLKYGAALREEMAQMRVRISSAGHEQFGAWREGTHDDLVFAVALACWGARRVYPHDLEGQAGLWQVCPGGFNGRIVR